jgi:two-component system copper resistance phosphate regulon response regulator CusR
LLFVHIGWHIWIMGLPIPKLLVVEDDPKTARSLVAGLQAEGFSAHAAQRGDDALNSLSATAYELVILDWMLPGRDGLQILRTIRERGNRVPVLLLTARDAVNDRVSGLEAGADDYLSKPFAFAELLARVRALLRRAVPPEPMRRQVDDLIVDFETRRASRAGTLLDLTPREFDLLAYLICHAAEAVSREQLAREVWRETSRFTPLDNVIDVHVARLRRKLDEGHARKLLHTIRGVGLMLKAETHG